MRSLVIIALLAAAACNGTEDGACPPSQRSCHLPSIPSPPRERCDPGQPRFCAGDEVVECDPEGVVGRHVRRCEEGCKNGACIASCDTEGNELIYLVDSDANLLSFDPRKLPGDPFHLIAKLDCEHFWKPTSMAVDRHGHAWVRYNSRNVYRVSIVDGACEPTSYLDPDNVKSFGMGFVTDSPKGHTEKLYLSVRDGMNTLAYMDPGAGDLTLHALGTIAATKGSNPELTGTAEGKLFGFFPARGGPTFIQEIDRASGAPVGERWPVTTLPPNVWLVGYAFAQWKGVFYVFLTWADANYRLSSMLRTVDRATGEARTILKRLPYQITVAGVSTCAPD